MVTWAKNLIRQHFRCSFRYAHAAALESLGICCEARRMLLKHTSKITCLDQERCSAEPAALKFFRRGWRRGCREQSAITWPTGWWRSASGTGLACQVIPELLVFVSSEECDSLMTSHYLMLCEAELFRQAFTLAGNAVSVALALCKGVLYFI